MAPEQRSGRPAEATSDGLRNPVTHWVPLGSVVYAWTDRRGASDDRSWWKTAGARLYVPFAKPEPPKEVSIAATAAPASMPQRSAEDAAASKIPRIAADVV